MKWCAIVDFHFIPLRPSSRARNPRNVRYGICDRLFPTMHHFLAAKLPHILNIDYAGVIWLVSSTELRENSNVKLGLNTLDWRFVLVDVLNIIKERRC